MMYGFKKGGDFHSRTAVSMYPFIENAIQRGEVIIDESERNENSNENARLVKDAFKQERHRAKILNFSIAYGKTALGLANDLGCTTSEAKDTIDLWYNARPEVKLWQYKQKLTALETGKTFTMLGRPRDLFINLNKV